MNSTMFTHNTNPKNPNYTSKIHTPLKDKTEKYEKPATPTGLRPKKLKIPLEKDIDEVAGEGSFPAIFGATDKGNRKGNGPPSYLVGCVRPFIWNNDFR